MNQTEFVEELKSVTGSAAKQPERLNNRLGLYYLDCNIEEKWIELGFDVKSLSEILGHASVKITMDRYVHPTMDLKQKHMDKLSVLISGRTQS